VWLGLAATLGGCSLITDLGGLGDGSAGDVAVDDARADAQDATDGDASTFVCPDAAIFCDDFESEPSTLPRWNGKAAVLPSTLDVTQSRAFHGASSMHASVSDTADSGAVQASDAVKFFAPMGDGSTFALRAYVYVTAPIETDAFFQLLHQNDNGHFINLGSSSDPAHCQNSVLPCVGTYLTGSTDVATGSGAALPIGAWTCLEWVVTVATAGHETVYVDGAVAIDVALDTMAGQTTGYDAVSAGLAGAYGTEGIFIDDVVVDTKRIGCE
jgi:hypothetical protein